MYVVDVSAPRALRDVAAMVALPADLLREVAAVGGVVAAAVTTEGAMVGATVAVRSTDGLHVWTTEVVEASRRQGVGTALMWHQRERALVDGLGTITWTFDPADVACARLTVATLGAEVTSYQRSWTVDGGDRVVATWALRSSRVTRAWHGVGLDDGSPELRVAPGPPLGVALEGGAHVVGVDDDGTWLLRGPG